MLGKLVKIDSNAKEGKPYFLPTEKFPDGLRIPELTVFCQGAMPEVLDVCLVLSEISFLFRQSSKHLLK